MNVTVNDKVTKWFGGRTQPVKDAFNTKCTEIINDDFTTWRNVGKSIYDYAIDGNLRAVATRSKANFNVAAVYKHGEERGKVKVEGADVPGY